MSVPAPCCPSKPATLALAGVLYAQTAEKVHGGDVVSHCLKFYLYSCICACGFVSGPTRKALREEYDLPVQPGFLAAQGANADCMTGTIPCVNCFALCQDAREANTRNITTPIYKVDPFEWAPLADRPTPAAAVATQAPAQPAMEK